MTSIRLSPRLQAICELVPPCGRVLDIGTDHAFLPISLVQSGRCEEALAIDIRCGPLNTAAAHIREAGLADRIGTLQNDGLAGIQTTGRDVLILAGLGGHEICSILVKAAGYFQAVIIQAMKSLPELRSWLSAQGYLISQEKLVRDREHDYVILVCVKDDAVQPLTRLEEVVGPVLLQTRPPELAGFLAKLLPRLYKQSRGDAALKPVIDQIEAFMKAL